MQIFKSRGGRKPTPKAQYLSISISISHFSQAAVESRHVSSCFLYQGRPHRPWILWADSRTHTWRKPEDSCDQPLSKNRKPGCFWLSNHVGDDENWVIWNIFLWLQWFTTSQQPALMAEPSKRQRLASARFTEAEGPCFLADDSTYFYQCLVSVKLRWNSHRTTHTQKIYVCSQVRKCPHSV